jgi:branched-chain amino acid transport system permease protein
MLNATLVSGIVLGFTYGLLAVTLILLVRTTGVLNFAVAELATLFAFIAFELHRSGLNALATVLITLLCAAAAGPVIYAVIIRPRRTTPLFLSLRTLGLLLILQALIEMKWGPNAPYTFPALVSSGRFAIVGMNVTYVQLASVIAALVIATGVGALTRSPRVGLLLRAVSADREAAQSLGVNVVLVDLVAWSAACVVAAASGVLYAQQTVLEPEMLAPVLLAAFAAAQIADMKSMPVALGSGVLLGIVQSTSAVYLNQPAWSQILSFVVLVGALLVRRYRSRTGMAVST